MGKGGGKGGGKCASRERFASSSRTPRLPAPRHSTTFKTAESSRAVGPESSQSRITEPFLPKREETSQSTEHDAFKGEDDDLDTDVIFDLPETESESRRHLLSPSPASEMQDGSATKQPTGGAPSQVALPATAKEEPTISQHQPKVEAASTPVARAARKEPLLLGDISTVSSTNTETKPPQDPLLTKDTGVRKVAPGGTKSQILTKHITPEAESTQVSHVLPSVAGMVYETSNQVDKGDPSVFMKTSDVKEGAINPAVNLRKRDVPRDEKDTKRMEQENTRLRGSRQPSREEKRKTPALVEKTLVESINKGDSTVANTTVPMVAQEEKSSHIEKVPVVLHLESKTQIQNESSAEKQAKEHVAPPAVADMVMLRSQTPMEGIPIQPFECKISIEEDHALKAPVEESDAPPALIEEARPKETPDLASVKEALAAPSHNDIASAQHAPQVEALEQRKPNPERKLGPGHHEDPSSSLPSLTQSEKHHPPPRPTNPEPDRDHWRSWKTELETKTLQETTNPTIQRPTPPFVENKKLLTPQRPPVPTNPDKPQATPHHVEPEAAEEQASDVVVAPAVAEPSVEAPRAEDVPAAEEKAVDIAPGAEEEVAAPAHAEEREAGMGESRVDEGLAAEEEASPSVEERGFVAPAVESPLEEESKEVEPEAAEEQASDVVVAPAVAEPSVEAPRAEDVPAAEEKAVDIAPGAEEEVAAPAHAEEREAGMGESRVDEGLAAEEEASPSVEERGFVAPAVESPLEEESKEVEPEAAEEQASDVVVAPAVAEPSVEAPRAEDVPAAEEKAVDIAPGAEEEVAAPAHAEEREAGMGESRVDEGLAAEEEASPSVEERGFVAPAVESPLEEESKEVEPEAAEEQASDVVVAPAVAEPSVEAPRAEDVPAAEEKAVDIAPGAEEEVAAPAHAEEREAGMGESRVDEGLAAEEEASPSVEERGFVAPAVESPLEEESKEVEPEAAEEQASDVVVAPAVAEPSVEAPRAEDVPAAEEKAVDIAPGAEEEVAAPAHAEEREAGMGESRVDEGLAAEEEASPSVEERGFVAPAVESPLEEESKEVEPEAAEEQASDVVVAPAVAEPSVEAPRAEDVPAAEEKAVDIAPGAEEEVAAPAHAEEREAGMGESRVDEGLAAEEEASPSVEERGFVAPAVESPLEEESKEVEPEAAEEQASDVVVAPAVAEPSVEAPRAEDVPAAEEKAVDIAPGAEEEVAAPAHAEEREAGMGESRVDEGLAAEEEASPSVEERGFVAPAVESPLEEESKEVEPEAAEEQASDVVVAPAVAEPSVEAPRAEDVPAAEEKAVDIAPGAEEEVAAPAHAEEREAGMGESRVDEGLAAEEEASPSVEERGFVAPAVESPLEEESKEVEPEAAEEQASDVVVAPAVAEPSVEAPRAEDVPAAEEKAVDIAPGAEEEVAAPAHAEEREAGMGESRVDEGLAAEEEASPSVEERGFVAPAVESPLEEESKEVEPEAAEEQASDVVVAPAVAEPSVEAPRAEDVPAEEKAVDIAPGAEEEVAAPAHAEEREAGMGESRVDEGLAAEEEASPSVEERGFVAPAVESPLEEESKEVEPEAAEEQASDVVVAPAVAEPSVEAPRAEDVPAAEEKAVDIAPGAEEEVAAPAHAEEREAGMGESRVDEGLAAAEEEASPSVEERGFVAPAVESPLEEESKEVEPEAAEEQASDVVVAPAVAEPSVEAPRAEDVPAAEEKAVDIAPGAEEEVAAPAHAEEREAGMGESRVDEGLAAEEEASPSVEERGFVAPAVESPLEEESKEVEPEAAEEQASDVVVAPAVAEPSVEAPRAEDVPAAEEKAVDIAPGAEEEVAAPAHAEEREAGMGESRVDEGLAAEEEASPSVEERGFVAPAVESPLEEESKEVEPEAAEEQASDVVVAPAVAEPSVEAPRAEDVPAAEEKAVDIAPGAEEEVAAPAHAEEREAGMGESRVDEGLAAAEEEASPSVEERGFVAPAVESPLEEESKEVEPEAAEEQASDVVVAPAVAEPSVEAPRAEDVPAAEEKAVDIAPGAEEEVAAPAHAEEREAGMGESRVDEGLAAEEEASPSVEERGFVAPAVESPLEEESKEVEPEAAEEQASDVVVAPAVAEPSVEAPRAEDVPAAEEKAVDIAPGAEEEVAAPAHAEEREAGMGESRVDEGLAAEEEASPSVEERGFVAPAVESPLEEESKEVEPEAAEEQASDVVVAPAVAEPSVEAPRAEDVPAAEEKAVDIAPGAEEEVAAPAHAEEREAGMGESRVDEGLAAEEEASPSVEERGFVAPAVESPLEEESKEVEPEAAEEQASDVVVAPAVAEPSVEAPRAEDVPAAEEKAVDIAPGAEEEVAAPAHAEEREAGMGESRVDEGLAAEEEASPSVEERGFVAPAVESPLEEESKEVEPEAAEEQASDVVVAPAVAEPSVEAPRAEDVPAAEEKAVDIAPGAEEEVAAPAHAEEREAGMGESRVDEGLAAEEEASPSVEERGFVAPAVESPLEEESKEVEPEAAEEQASDVVVAPAVAEPSVEAPRAEDVPAAEEKAVDIAPGAEEEVAAPAHAEEREAGMGESRVDEGLAAEEEASPSVEERGFVAPAVESPLEEESKEVEPEAAEEQASDVVVAPAVAEPSVEAPRAEDVPAEEKAVDIAPGAEEEVAAPAHAEEREAGMGESRVDEGLAAEEEASPSVEERGFVAPAVESPLEEESKEKVVDMGLCGGVVDAQVGFYEKCGMEEGLVFDYFGGVWGMLRKNREEVSVDVDLVEPSLGCGLDGVGYRVNQDGKVSCSSISPVVVVGGCKKKSEEVSVDVNLGSYTDDEGVISNSMIVVGERKVVSRVCRIDGMEASEWELVTPELAKISNKTMNTISTREDNEEFVHLGKESLIHGTKEKSAVGTEWEFVAEELRDIHVKSGGSSAQSSPYERVNESLESSDWEMVPTGTNGHGERSAKYTEMMKELVKIPIVEEDEIGDLPNKGEDFFLDTSAGEIPNSTNGLDQELPHINAVQKKDQETEDATIDARGSKVEFPFEKLQEEHEFAIKSHFNMEYLKKRPLGVATKSLKHGIQEVKMKAHKAILPTWPPLPITREEENNTHVDTHGENATIVGSKHVPLVVDIEITEEPSVATTKENMEVSGEPYTSKNDDSKRGTNISGVEEHDSEAFNQFVSKDTQLETNKTKNMVNVLQSLDNGSNTLISNLLLEGGEEIAAAPSA